MKIIDNKGVHIVFWFLVLIGLYQFAVKPLHVSYIAYQEVRGTKIIHGNSSSGQNYYYTDSVYMDIVNHYFVPSNELLNVKNELITILENCCAGNEIRIMDLGQEYYHIESECNYMCFDVSCSGSIYHLLKFMKEIEEKLNRTFICSVELEKDRKLRNKKTRGSKNLICKIVFGMRIIEDKE